MTSFTYFYSSPTKKYLFMKKLFLSLILFSSLNSFAQIPSYIDTPGLLGWYPFTGNLNDSSGNNYNGVCYGSSSTIYAIDRFGHSSSSFGIMSPGPYFQVDYPISLNTSTFTGITISAWVYMYLPPIPSHPENIFLLTDSSSAFQKQFCVNYDNASYKIESCNGINGMTCYDALYETDTTKDSTWYHVVLTSDFTTPQTSLYINGVLQGISTDTIIKPLIKYLRLGMMYGGFWEMISGAIDDVGLWNKPLSNCKIAQLYQSSIITSIIAQPSNDTVYTGSIATYSITDSNTTSTYKWQLDTGAGFVDIPSISPYSGITTKTLTINPTTSLMNNYRYRCLVLNSCNCNDTSNSAILVVNSVSSVSNIFDNFIVSPNPVSSELSIKSAIEINKVEIVNLLGQVILAEYPNKINPTINLSELTKGLYILKLNNNYFTKVVKN